MVIRKTKLGCERLERRELLACNLLQITPEISDHDSLLVRFRDANAANASIGQSVAGTRIDSQLTTDGWYSVTVSTGTSMQQALAFWQSHPNVAIVTPDFELTTQSIPNDPQFGSLWGLINYGAQGGLANADINIEPAWALGTATNVVTAVIDTGVDYTHPDLAANIWSNTDEVAGNGIDDDGNGYIDDIRGWDFVSNDSDPMDDNGHGTHVAGTIGAVGDNGIGVTGVAWKASIMPLKFLDQSGSGSLSNAIKAIQYARVNGAKIINASWGGGGFSSALQSAISQFITSGGLFVAAAGNEATNNDVTPSYPANYQGVISVGASTRTDTRASFSNFGTSVDVFAPGQSILSTLPGNRYGSLSGTSMATPQVAGALALLWGQNPTLTATTISQALINNTDNILRALNSTHGRINVGAAATALRTSNPTTPPTNPPTTPPPTTPVSRSFGIQGNFAIADATATRASVQRFTINVNENIRIQDLDVQLQIQHTYASDLVIRLIAPSGTTQTLIQRRGGFTQNIQTTLSDEATGRLNNWSSIRGTLRAEGSLAVFDGMNARGEWTIEILDAARGDVGTLQIARLLITGTPLTSSMIIARNSSATNVVIEPVRFRQSSAAVPMMSWFNGRGQGVLVRSNTYDNSTNCQPTENEHSNEALSLLDQVLARFRF
ncbi:MAG: S8 family serine peptidase [Pirellula sp.]|jgi:subtilisin family serine protease|nr:S8 family serine peptidase [Pirellula sp.]